MNHILGRNRLHWPFNELSRRSRHGPLASYVAEHWPLECYTEQDNHCSLNE